MSEPTPPSGYRCTLCYDSGRIPSMMAWGASVRCPLCEQREIDERKALEDAHARELAKMARRSTDRPLPRAVVGAGLVLAVAAAIAVIVRGG